MAELAIEGVVKRYGNVVALSGVDLEIGAGEFFVILGPSAAGKTTTLRTIAGLERPDAGTIRFAGQDITRAPVQGRGMAMIFQTFALYPHLSTFDNLAYPLRENGVAAGETRRRVGEIAEMLGIVHTLGRKPATLSGGEQRAEFKRLHRELGMTMVYATPDQLEALTMGDRIALLRAGRIVQTGSPDALYRAPLDSFVATMVGAPPMNLVPGRVRERTGGLVLELPFGEVDASRWRHGLTSGAEILLGVRPHDLHPARAEPEGPRFPATVHLTEPLGDVTVIDLDAGGAVLKMALPEEEALAYRHGNRLAVELSLADAHLFDRRTGAALA
ncbi:MAG: transporter ATP-binding protein [Geminicoccaceae bacterium]|nr:transporter ATP-binding protein [Geminicoccaceae bacterium]